jgi:imidazole glycerol-phosphate synthase subunit HisH
MATVGIIDYGMGNLRSVEKGFEKVGVKTAFCDKASSCDWYDALVLPGVGAFRDAIEVLREKELDVALNRYIATGRHLLGICLGMQLMMEHSEEYGHHEGLGLVPGGCMRLPDDVKVPHMGWNVLDIVRPNALFDGLESGERFYFVHSYYCAPSDESWVIGRTDYGGDFTCALGKDNVWGLQFHPEKSSLLGLHILENFGRMAGALT